MKYSIVIPVYNVEKYLDKCIESVISQRETNYEILLIDDGSSDSSGGICERWKQRDERICVIHQKNKGLAEARNVGIRNASGDFLLFLDSDDYWYDDTVLSEINKKIATMPEIDVLICSYVKHFLDNNKWIVKKVPKINEGDLVCEKLLKNGAFYNSAWCKVLKREFVISNNLFFNVGMLCEDLDWSCKILRCTQRIDVIDHISVVYQVNREGSICAVKSNKKFMDAISQMKKDIALINDEQNEQIKKAAYAYWAYQFSWIIAEPGNSEMGIQQGYEYLQNYKWILNFALDSKSKTVKRCINIIGLKNTMFLITKYLYG